MKELTQNQSMQTLAHVKATIVPILSQPEVTSPRHFQQVLTKKQRRQWWH